MKEFLQSIREEEHISKEKAALAAAAILLTGIILGIFAKRLDTTPVNDQLPLFAWLDFTNFLSRLTFWLVSASCIAMFSSSPKYAALNVFSFFAGLVAAYYLYSRFAVGFFPRSYAMIWVTITVISPFLAWACWYAKGEGKTAVFLSALILGTVAWSAVNTGFWYINIVGIPDVILLFIMIAVLWRRNIKESLVMIVIGFITAVLLQNLLPFSF